MVVKVRREDSSTAGGCQNARESGLRAGRGLKEVVSQEVMPSKDSKAVRRGPCEYLGKEFQAEGTANAKVLRQEYSWHNQGTAKKPLWLEQSR